VDDPIVTPARYEVKMTCDEAYLPEVRTWVRLHPERFVEAYAPRQVNNVYLDTPAADYLDAHLCGVMDRQKLRYRWYGRQDDVVQGALEIKSKSGSLSWKRQYPIPRTFDLTRVSWRDWMEQVRACVDGEMAYRLSPLLRPSLLNRYWREYYVTFDGQLRLTLDYQLQVYDQRMHRVPNLQLSCDVERCVVVEVKAPPTCGRRLSDLFSHFRLQVGRNSKYVTGMESVLSV
jgi:hypothetical protein